MAYKVTDKCKGCDECAQICPTKASSGEMKEKHEIDPNRCIDCGACVNVCEYEALVDQFGKACKYTPKEKWKKPVVDEALCDGCSICVEECPANCLEIIIPEGKGEAHGVSHLTDTELCHGCGMCERHCPIEAITLK